MTDRTLTRLLHKHIPARVDNNLLWLLRDCGITLSYSGAGLFRTVFKIEGTRWVIKLPFNRHVDCRSDDCVAHASQEYTNHRRLLRYERYKPLRRYLPKILFYRKGVLVMEECSRLPHNLKRKAELIEEQFMLLMRRSCYDQDLHSKNFGVDARGRIKAIDLGRLYGGV